METQEKFTLVIRGARPGHLHESQRHMIGRELARFMAGEDVDLDRLKPYGIDVQVGPAAVLGAAADFLDDGFHDRLIADLREVADGGELEEVPPAGEDARARC